jgi:hypothetical protein
MSPIAYRQTSVIDCVHYRKRRKDNLIARRAENHRAAVALHFAHYNFVRVHNTLRVAPAMAAGVSDRLWTLGELVEQTSR